MTLLKGSLLFLLVISLTGCGVRGQSFNLKRQLEAYERGRRETRLIYVNVVYEFEGKLSSFHIERAAVAPGSPPLLLDDPDLEGRVELLDHKGRVLWSMGYRPENPAVSPSGNRPSKTRLVLRLPCPKKARRVRVVERKRSLCAEAEIIPLDR